MCIRAGRTDGRVSVAVNVDQRQAGAAGKCRVEDVDRTRRCPVDEVHRRRAARPRSHHQLRRRGRRPRQDGEGGKGKPAAGPEGGVGNGVSSVELQSGGSIAEVMTNLCEVSASELLEDATRNEFCCPSRTAAATRSRPAAVPDARREIHETQDRGGP